MDKLLRNVLDSDCSRCAKRKKNSHDCEYHKQLNANSITGRIDEWTESQLKETFKKGTCPWLDYK